MPVLELSRTTISVVRPPHSARAPHTLGRSKRPQEVFDELLTRPYLVCEKTDGERYILLAHEGRVYLIDRRVRFWLCPIQLPLPSSDPRAPGWHHNTLLDGELGGGMRS